jgi:ATP-dependent RNA helicase RhlE
MEPAVRGLAKTLVKDPVEITIEPEKPTVERINQSVYFVDRKDKDELLISMLRDEKVTRVVVFTQMKHVANKVATLLDSHGIRADAIHGNKSQSAREHALKLFRDGKVRVLVATDIAARGIDVDGVSHVINYELPREPESYVHRIGRTARAGAEGDAMSLCMPEERDLLRQIEKFIKQPVPVVTEHKWHSEYAMNVRGPGSRPPAKKQFKRFNDRRKGRG